MSNRAMKRSVARYRAQEQLRNIQITNELKNIVNRERWYWRLFVAVRIIMGVW